MAPGDSPRTRLVAWNGLRFSLPATWEPRVAGSRHLVFEEDFQPRLQLSWQKKAGTTGEEIRRLAEGLAGPGGSVDFGPDVFCPGSSFAQDCQLLLSLHGEGGQVAGGVRYCRTCETLLHFQVLGPSHWSRLAVGRWLATLSCHGQKEWLWRMQDFSLVTPAAFALTDFHFASGLTRLSFADRDVRLETCRLAPADIRLRHHSLAEILLTLCGGGELVTWQDETGQSCQAMRAPGIAGWLLLRLRRQRPYLRALIRHDAAANRLLAVIVSAKRRIRPELLLSLASHYEIVQEERTATAADPN